MPLTPGTRLGVFDVIGLLGAGGMGEVYRARDTTLGRDVAIKVIPQAFADDAERLARFIREAQTLAALNHPNIAHLHGLEDSDAGRALVMEFVDGEDLAQRLERGALPYREAIAIARQIADALEAAHDHGIVHRDLKPANVKVRGDGTVKVLDFGLAKALEPAGGKNVATLAHSPTFTAQATHLGTIIGTAGYMAPEQARGLPVDKRADIWAFGVVLYEMFTGRSLFAGGSVTDTLAAVLTHEPDWSGLPAAVPRGARRVLERCLVKDVRRRLRDIGDARADLDDEESVDPGRAAPGPVPASRWRRVLPWALATFATVAAGLAIVRGPMSATHAGLTYVDIPYPPGIEPVSSLGGGFAMSPDGRTVAMIGSRNGMRRVYFRRLDEPTPLEAPESAGVTWVTFSPDGRSIAFVSGTGSVVTLSLVDQQRRELAAGFDQVTNGTWVAAGVVTTRDGALWLVPVEGSPRQLTKLDTARREVIHVDPVALPDGRTVLFSCMTGVQGSERIEAVSLESGARRVILERAMGPAWSPTGHLLFSRDGAVLAAPADAATGSIRGPAVTVIPAGTVGLQGSGTPGYRLSSNGTLLFLPAESFTKRLVMVNRDGAARALDLPASRYSNPRVSPDGARLLVEGGGTVIEALDLARGTRTTVAPAAVATAFSTWTSDGQRVVVRRFYAPTWVATDGSAREGIPPHVITNDYPSGPGPDPDSILMVRVNPTTGGDIYQLSLSGQYEPRPLVQSNAYDGGPQLSPDGRWLVHQSSVSGTPEIYVRRWTELTRAWQVSSGGGVQPRWNGNGEICYRGGPKMMGVKFDAGPQPVIGNPQPLFADEYDYGQGLSIANYDVTREGRFIMLRRAYDGNTLRLAVDWTKALQRMVAAGGAK